MITVVGETTGVISIRLEDIIDSVVANVEADITVITEELWNYWNLIISRLTVGFLNVDKSTAKPMK